jgi:hypothetical protein
VPTLLEMQQAMRGGLIGGDIAIATMLADGIAPDRLDIYRNTVMLTLTKALRLCYPAVGKLVGEEFFGAAAEVFVASHLPRAAYLDQYGGDFPEFLSDFESAATLPYLADVARLEWAVNGALRAPDAGPLDLQALAKTATNGASQVRLIPHPSVRWLRVSHPADVIWRAVLDGDDRALAAIDLDTGVAHLLVEKGASGVAAHRLDEVSWRFGERLSQGEFLQAAIETTPGIDATRALAEHLALGRFVAFEVSPADVGSTRQAGGSN